VGAAVPALGCDRCAGPAVVWQRYSGLHLCGRHLCESVEARARREVQRQTTLPHGVRVLVGYSGGKDSTVALHLMHRLREARPDVELVALTVDEGIEGYRPDALRLAADVCRELGVEHVVRRTRDTAGFTIDEAQAADPEAAACGVCGVFRRRLLNDAARDIGADRVVTGHNLDDLAQTVLMNLTSANLDKLAKLAPHATTKPGFVPRVLPLRTVPETEVYLYAHLRGLRFHDQECPYAERAQRGVYRDVLYRLEEARPGTRHALLNVHEDLRPLLSQRLAERPLRPCPACGEPTSGARCKACDFRAAAAPPLPARNPT
jgi:uncharacterized protein (TIGR00269 family)